MSGRLTSYVRLSFDDKSEARRQDSIRSGSDVSVKDKDPSTSTASSWFRRNRSTSEGAAKPSSNHVNLYTHCGRHTNQYLFGGHSLSGSIKGLIKKKE